MNGNSGEGANEKNDVEETLEKNESEQIDEKDDGAEGSKKSEAKYTEEDLDRIIKEKVSRERKKHLKELEDQKKSLTEAQKLEKMTEDEKAKYELEKLQKENAELKKSQNLTEQMAIARKELVEIGTPMPDALLKVFVSDDADTTKAAIDEIKELWPKAIDDAVKKALKGKVPPGEPNDPKKPSVGASYAQQYNEQRVPKKEA